MSKSLTKEQFLQRAKAVHGNEKFSYEFAEYVNYQTKIKILCLKHNELFQQTPNNHLSGQGCPLCKGETTGVRCRSDTDTFIIKARAIHGEATYGYEKVVYKTNTDKVIIMCKEHGEFHQTPHDHLSGKGCLLCWVSKFAEDRRFDNSIFTEKAIMVHGDGAYDYRLVDYIGYHIPVKIICKEHGVFNQRPANHLNGVGCPCCANYGFDLNDDAVLYVHEVLGINHCFTGYGITKNETVRTKKHIRELSKNGYIITASFITQRFPGKFIHGLETLITKTFTTDPQTSTIPGFKRESTTADYATVVAFVQNYIAEHNNKQETITWQPSTLAQQQIGCV